MTDKKDQLLDAAEALFGENGFEGTSMRMLAQRSGMNVAMVSYYFGSKEKMFAELVRRRTEKTRSGIERADEEEKNPVIKMELIIDTLVDNIFTNRHFHRIMWREITLEQRPELNDAIGDLLFRNKKQIHKIIEAGILSGHFRKVDVDLSISTLFGTIHSVMMSEKLTLKMIGEKNLKRLYSSLPERLKAHLKDWLHIYLSTGKKYKISKPKHL